MSSIFDDVAPVQWVAEAAPAAPELIPLTEWLDRGGRGEDEAPEDESWDPEEWGPDFSSHDGGGRPPGRHRGCHRLSRRLAELRRGGWR